MHRPLSELFVLGFDPLLVTNLCFLLAVWTAPDSYLFPPFRIVRLVMVLRDWASKSLQEEQQRPDPFLVRFQGPELQTVPADASSGPEDEEAEEKTKK